ncbi:MAG: hypothetical protein IPJ73_22000 [Zoogloea sp.]|nr:hypothetical protein [Zoogloea sp.]
MGRITEDDGFLPGPPLLRGPVPDPDQGRWGNTFLLEQPPEILAVGDRNRAQVMACFPVSTNIDWVAMLRGAAGATPSTLLGLGTCINNSASNTLYCDDQYASSMDRKYQGSHDHLGEGRWQQAGGINLAQQHEAELPASAISRLFEAGAGSGALRTAQYARDATSGEQKSLTSSSAPST